MRLLLPLFIAIPILEIALLIKVGGIIGLAPTLLAVIGTAMAGVWLLRREGLDTWFRVQQRLAEGQLPGSELLEGAMLLFGGALLLTPGFMTDAIGFVCLVPVMRKPIARRLLKLLLANAVSVGMPPRSRGARGDRAGGSVIIEGEFREESDRGSRAGTRTGDGGGDQFS